MAGAGTSLPAFFKCVLIPTRFSASGFTQVSVKGSACTLCGLGRGWVGGGGLLCPLGGWGWCDWLRQWGRWDVNSFWQSFGAHAPKMCHIPSLAVTMEAPVRGAWVPNDCVKACRLAQMLGTMVPKRHPCQALDSCLLHFIISLLRLLAGAICPHFTKYFLGGPDANITQLTTGCALWETDLSGLSQCVVSHPAPPQASPASGGSDLPCPVRRATRGQHLNPCYSCNPHLWGPCSACGSSWAHHPPPPQLRVKS